MRFELRRLPNYSDEAILAEIRRVAELVQHPTLSLTKFRSQSRVSPTTIFRRFGSWKMALQAAGVGGRFDSSNKAVSREDVLAELQRVATLLRSQVFSRDQFNAHARFTDATVRNRFGTWHTAMKAAGLRTAALGKRYTEDDCFENLLSVWTHYGRAPTYDEMKRPPSSAGPKAYVHRFGTWAKALKAFIDRANSDNPVAEQTNDGGRGSFRKQKTAIPESDKREIRLGLRYAVLKRDRFRCVACGRSPATHLGVALHVDHALPVARGGKTILENLQTLCEECNLGKGPRHGG